MTGTFETPDGVWRSLPEIHPRHEEVMTDLNNLPPTLDIVSYEGIRFTTTFEGNKPVKHGVYTKELASLFIGELEGFDRVNSSPQIAFPLETLEHMKKHGIKAAFGDVEWQKERFTLDPTDAFETRKKMGIALILGGAGVAATGTARSRSMTRRRFLQTAGAVAFGAGLAASVPPALRIPVHEAVMSSYDKGYIARRVAARLSTITLDLLPEFLNGLFRELIQANKLMTVARNWTDPKGKKPYIGYNWHLVHGGIEDWLRLGPGITRACIEAYPDSVLREVVGLNLDDPRCLWATREAEVPKSLKVQPTTYQNGLTVTSYRYDPNEKSFDKIVEDAALKERLSRRLSL